MIDLQKCVLGGLIISDINRPEVTELIDTCRADWFEKEYKTIFEAIRELRREHSTIDLITVAQKTSGLVQPYFLATITDEVTSTANLPTHIRLLQQDYVKKRLHSLTTQIASNPSEDPFKDIQVLKNELHELELTREYKTNSLYELGKLRVQEIESRRQTGVKTVGRQSGFHKLDSYIGGLVPGELIITAGRPGMGKTSFAVNLGIEHCKRGGVTMMFSIEMPENQITDRALSSETGLDNFKIRNTDLSDYDMVQIRAIDLPRSFYINDNSRMNIDQISAAVAMAKRKYGLTFVILDYLQLVRAELGNRNREQEVAYISAECKRIAKDCGVTVMALAQLSRKVEERGSKVPMLSDLRESGSIEQDADVVLFPYRPQYYQQVQEPIEPAELHIGKCRNGQTGYIDIQFKGSTTQYIF